MRDEINRLKGEKGRPEFKRKDKISPGDKASQSGEKAYKRTNHKTGTTKARLVIDQTIELKKVGQELPTLCALMSDDAPEYKLRSPLHALCWIHDGRDYKKLVPQLDINRRQTDALMDEY